MVDKEQQNIYYSNLLTAWFNTKLEHDKSIFTLSAGGIGLLIGLITTKGVNSPESLLLFIGATTCFIACLIMLLLIFKENASYIEKVLENSNTKENHLLQKLDKLTILSFLLGIIFTSIIGISMAISSMNEKGRYMSNNDTHHGNQSELRESFDNLNKLKPSGNLDKSFDGAGKLKPNDQANQQNQDQSQKSK